MYINGSRPFFSSSSEDIGSCARYQGAATAISREISYYVCNLSFFLHCPVLSLGLLVELQMTYPLTTLLNTR